MSGFYGVFNLRMILECLKSESIQGRSSLVKGGQRFRSMGGFPAQLISGPHQDG